MAATKIISGVNREVWEELVAHTEGVTRAITTGLKASTAILSRVDARVYLSNGVGTPNFAGTLSVVAGKLVITIINGSILASSATYIVDVQILHSLTQSRGSVPGRVEIIAGQSAYQGAPAQNELLFYGRKAKIDSTWLAFGLLVPGLDFDTLDTNGAPLTYLIDAALVGATTLLEATTAMAAILNADVACGYEDWIGSATGLSATAKLYGSAYNVVPTGTALVGEVGSVATVGQDAISSSVPVDVLVANDYDPQVSGLPVTLLSKSRAFTYDGTKSWEKDGRLATSWRRTDNPDPVTLAEKGARISTGNVLDTKSGWKITFKIRGTDGTTNVTPTVNINDVNTDMKITGTLVANTTTTANGSATAGLIEAQGTTMGIHDAVAGLQSCRHA